MSDNKIRVHSADLAAMPGGPHPIPSRTRSLSPPGPMVLRLKARESRSLPGLPNALGILFKTPSFPDDVRSDLPLHVISVYMRTPLTRGGAAPFETPKAEQTVKNAGRLTGKRLIAGWSSPVARQAHNLKVVGSNPAPAPKIFEPASLMRGFFAFWRGAKQSWASLAYCI